MKAFLTGVGKRATQVFVNGSFVDTFNADTKANTNGVYVNLTAGYAENLTPLTPESGTTQEAPFILQRSGSANGASQIDPGSYCQLKKKLGNTIVVNQTLTNGDFSSGITGWESSDVTGTSVSDNVLTFTASATNGRIRHYFDFLPGNKYIVIADINLTTATNLVQIRAYNGADGINFSTASKTGWQTVFGIVSFDTIVAGGNLQIRDTRSSGWDAIQVANVRIVNLSVWFGATANVPADLLSNPQDFFRYYQGSLSYNVGTLTNSNGQILTSIGRNVWDGEHDVKCIPNQAYYCYGSATITYKDFGGDTISSESKNNASFTTPINCGSFSVSGTGVCISLYDSEKSGYDQYYQYEVLQTVDTGSEDLGKFDSKTPDGLITYGGNEVDLSTLTFTATGASGHLVKATISDMKSHTDGDTVSGAICSNRTEIAYSASSADGAFQISGTSILIWVEDNTSFTITGTLRYPVATPTTEQGTSFIENIRINDLGTMGISATSFNGVPMGNSTFYPVDYKEMIDTLNNYTDGNIAGIALKGALGSSDPQTLKDLLDYINALIPSAPDEDGTYTLKVIVASGEATYSWVADT